MAVSITLTVSQYVGNNSAAIAYPTGFQFQDSSWLKVYVTTSAGVMTLLTLGANYSVAGAGNLSGGSIVTTLAYASTNTITIARVTPVTQLLDLEYNDRLPSQLVEDSLDKLTFITQELAADAQNGNRCIRFPFAEPLSNPTALPVPAERKDKVLWFNNVTGAMELVTAASLIERVGGVGFYESIQLGVVINGSLILKTFLLRV